VNPLRERFRDHLKKKEVLDHFHFIVWRELLWSYQPYLAQGRYAEALSIIDELIRSTANSSLQEINEQNLLFDLNQLKIERLCIMKLMNVAMELIEKEELVIQSQINQLKESDQKNFLLAFSSFFSPIQKTNNIETAKNYLNQIKSESEPSRNLLELCKINSGETTIEKNKIPTEVISKMRFLTNGSIILKLMFEAERLMKSGQKEEAKQRLELLDQWFANDKLIPAHVIVLFNRIKHDHL
jgi:hypothetical protein